MARKKKAVKKEKPATHSKASHAKAAKHPKHRKHKAAKKLPLIGKDPFDVLRFVVMTEKAIQMIETQNKLVFVVDRRKDRTEIRDAVESAFQTKVDEVNTVIDQEGKKRAFIKFKEAGQAGEIAIRLGII